MNTFNEVNMRPLSERQEDVRAKIAALPSVGGKIIELLASTVDAEELRNLILMGTMGQELWDEYWAVHRDTVEHNAQSFFEQMSKSQRKNIF